ncbi:MAG: hypothetical protein H0W85_10275 [Methylotenera sp.]|nr:hypothetical protein [Methylotenera sp.]
MYKQVIGWDVGGAHLKAALLHNGKLQQVMQVPCALWRGVHELEAAIDSLMTTFKIKSEETLHAITMTGELVDLFENRQQGVESISSVMNAKLKGEKLFYAGMPGHQSRPNFVRIDEVAKNWSRIASANWLASASYLGMELESLKNYSQILLVDIGSTTSDFIVIKNGKPHCLAFTDATRLQTEELVYTGVIRTPLMALTQKVRFKNKLTSLAAEYFATIADVYRLTDDLDEANDMGDTADGKEKTLQASARRLARMIGHDVQDYDLEAWKALANEFKQIQLSRLIETAKQHITRMGPAEAITIVGAGAGSFLVKEIAAQFGLLYQDSVFLFSDLSEDVTNYKLNHKTTNKPIDKATDKTTDIKHGANVCLPAYAVACLALNIGIT